MGESGPFKLRGPTVKRRLVLVLFLAADPGITGCPRPTTSPCSPARAGSFRRTIPTAPFPNECSAGFGAPNVAGTSENDVWVMGYGTLAHFDGTAWRTVPLSAANAVGGYRLGSTSSTAWVVGTNVPVIYSVAADGQVTDHTSSLPALAPTRSRGLQMQVNQSALLLAIHESDTMTGMPAQTLLFHLKDGALVPLPGPTAEVFWLQAVANDNLVWVHDSDHSERWDGSQWTVDPVAGSSGNIMVTAQGVVWLLDADNAVHRWTEGGWQDAGRLPSVPTDGNCPARMPQGWFPLDTQPALLVMEQAFDPSASCDKDGCVQCVPCALAALTVGADGSIQERVLIDRSNPRSAPYVYRPGGEFCGRGQLADGTGVGVFKDELLIELQADYLPE
jgi:hypothetical protein